MSTDHRTTSPTSPTSPCSDVPPDPAVDPDWPTRHNPPTEADRAWLVAAGAESARMRRLIARWQRLLASRRRH